MNESFRVLREVIVRSIIGALRGRRPKGEVVRQMYQVGNRSLVFIAVTLGFIGMVLVYQTCLQVNKITGDLSQVGGEFCRVLVHEFGPSLTALMLATRVGAGIAAEIGSMHVTEQLDALRMNGVEPIEYLIVPRFIASLLMTAVLTMFGISVAMAMGTLTAYASFHVNPTTFLDFSKVLPGDAITGGLKCLAYGATIPLIAGYCGLTTTGGSEGVGWATTRAVINGSFAVILLDFVLSGLGYFVFQGGG
jgi:phospholipid/cholesterol/gamma-HCH transport system permease protein